MQCDASNEDSEHDAAEESGEDDGADGAHGADEDAMARDGGDGVGSGACADDTRMANNPKGQYEMKAFKALGIVLQFNGLNIEEGIRDYEADRLQGMTATKFVRKYGLMQSRFDLWRGPNKVAGKKLLMIRDDALRHIFGDASIHRYQDLWRVDGALDLRARAASPAARQQAMAAFQESLAIRTEQARRRGGAPDAGHQDMIKEMQRWIERMEAL